MEKRKGAAISSIPGLAGSGGAAAGSAADSLVEILATWGAGAVAESAAILDALASFGAPERLRQIHDRAAARLSPQLASEIAEALELLESGGSREAPSLRARLQDLVRKAAAELAALVAGEREAAAASFGRWSAALPWADTTRMLESLWASEPGTEVETSLDALDRLEALGLDLAQARERIRAELQKRVAGGGTEAREIAQAASEALRQDEPEAIARCLGLLSRHGSGADAPGASSAAGETLRRLQALHEEGLGLLTDAAAPLPPAQARSLEQALSRATESQEPAAVTRWVETLETVLPEIRRTAADARASRDEVAASLSQDLERAGLGSGPEIPALTEQAKAGGAAWAEAVSRALEAIARREKELAATLSKAAGPLRAACQRLSALLEKESRHLPAARVVQARLWLEQAEGLIAEGEVDGIATLTETLTAESKALEGLATIVSRRQKNREEGERDGARREIARLKEAAGGREAAALAALEKEIETADAAALTTLRRKAFALEAAIESEVRSEAGLLLHAADRIKGTKAAEIGKAAETVRAALGRDDLAAARAAIAALRQKVNAAAPLTRPSVRMSLAAAAALLVIGAGASVRLFRSAPPSCRLTLASPPSAQLTLKLVSGGTVAAQATYGPGDAGGITLSLPEGRYEIYVNDRYTGRAFQVPGETEVSGIPAPPGSRP